MSEKQNELVEPEESLPPVTLEELPEVMQRAARQAGWASLTPVQTRACPYYNAKGI